MSKKTTTKRASAHKATVGLDAIAAVPEVPIVEVPAGNSLKIIVDVGEMAIPYTVAYAGKTLIKSLVDRAEEVPLQAGDRILGWAFAHVVKKWHHTIAYSIDGGKAQVLEERSETEKHPDHSVGIALIRVASEEE